MIRLNDLIPISKVSKLKIKMTFYKPLYEITQGQAEWYENICEEIRMKRSLDHFTEDEYDNINDYLCKQVKDIDIYINGVTRKKVIEPDILFFLDYLKILNAYRNDVHKFQKREDISNFIFLYGEVKLGSESYIRITEELMKNKIKV